MGTSGKDVEAVYRMLYPKPKPLLQYCKELVRHGELIYYSPNTNSTKPRYFFLFDTALLLTKRTGKKRYWLKIYVHLRHGVTLVDNGPTDTQFRLMVTVKGRSRPIIMYGKNQQHKDLWVRDLKQVLWTANGRKGPDPSLTDPATSSPSAGGRRGPQQPPQAAARDGKEAKSQHARGGFDASPTSARRFEGEDDDNDDDDDEADDFGNQSDDSEEEAEVEFMNVKKDKSGRQGATAPHEQEVSRLTHGLDSLVFDPFSDFIPPTAPSALSSTTATAGYPPSLASYPALGMPYGVPGNAMTPIPFSPDGAHRVAFTPFGPAPVAHPGPVAYGNPFAPPVAAAMPPGPGATLPAFTTFDPAGAATQQAHDLYQQQLHLQQQLHHLALLRQQYPTASSHPVGVPTYAPSAPEDPFLTLAHRGE